MATARQQLNTRNNQYTVRPGDTLSAIAKKYNTDIANITGCRSGNKNMIFPNEVLTIGTSAPATALKNPVTTNFVSQTYEPEPVIPEFDFREALEQKDSVTKRINDLRRQRASIQESALDQYSELMPDQQRLGSIQSQLDALKIQRQGIPTRVQEQFRGRGVTDSAARNVTSQELSRNALQTLDLSAEGQFLQGNINTALDLIEQSTKMELAPITTRLEMEEANLDRLIDNYNNEADSYSKRIKAEAEAQKEKIKEERQELEDLRDMRKDLRIIALEARKGNAPSSVVQQIMLADSYEDAIAKAQGYLDLAPGVMARQANRFNRAPTPARSTSRRSTSTRKITSTPSKTTTTTSSSPLDKLLNR